MSKTQAPLQSGVAPEQQELYYNGQELTEPKKTLEEYGVGQDDLLLMRRKPPAMPRYKTKLELEMSRVLCHF